MPKKEEFFTEQTDYLVCPHCGYEHDYQGESEPFFNCHNCEKEFAFSIESQPIFTSQTLEEYLKDEIKRMQNSISYHRDCIEYCETDISELQEKLNKLKEE